MLFQSMMSLKCVLKKLYSSIEDKIIVNIIMAEFSLPFTLYTGFK